MNEVATEKKQANPNDSKVLQGDVLIIGTGFSGLGVAAKLDEAGIKNWLILEKADSVGGTWRDNTYPGCECDIPSALYSYSFDLKPDWSHLFSPQKEIFQYLKEFSKKRNLNGRIKFGQTVKSAIFNEQTSRWLVETTSGNKYDFKHLISAVGVLHRPNYPSIKGLETFTGKTFHSSSWDHTYDLKGKKVAVIGSGASAIQFVPAIINEVESLTLYQRSAPWVLPKQNYAYTQEEISKKQRSTFKRWNERMKLFWIHEKRAKSFTNISFDNQKTISYALRHIEKQVPDIELRQKVTPDYALGCKRLLISNDWYPALSAPKTTVLTSDIKEITPDSIVTQSGESTKIDCIIFGTGFNALDALGEIQVVGKKGVRLNQIWNGKAPSYLGTMVNQFPNFFTMIGPNTGLGHNSQVFMIERQIKYIISAVKKTRKKKHIEVRKKVQEQYQVWLKSQLKNTVWNAGGCTSWYIDPKTGENILLWPANSIAFWRKTFVLKKSLFELK